MKVLLVSRFPDDPAIPRGGIEAVTVVLAQALARLPEVEVEVLTVEKRHVTVEVSTIDGIRVHRLPQSGWPQILDVHLGPSHRRIQEKIREIQPDIVHWHETWGLPAHSSKVPQVYTIHGFDSENVVAEQARFKRLRAVSWAILERRGFSRHEDVISITPYVKKKIQSCTAARIFEIDNPLDERFFDLPNTRESEARVLCVGWISPRKNTLMSVRAFASACAKNAKGKLILAGAPSDDAYFQRVKQEVEENGLKDQVEFLGYVNRDQLSEELSRASILLLPSLQENAPMAITEAMAAGLPVIASNRCGMPYMVEDEKSGFLIEPDDLVGIVSALERLLKSEELRWSMGQRGRLIAQNRFHPSRVAEKTLQVYRTILSRETNSTESFIAAKSSSKPSEDAAKPAGQQVGI